MYYDLTNNTELKNRKELKFSRPNIGFTEKPTDEELAKHGVAKIVYNHVSPTEYQTVEAQSLEIINGVPTANYILIDKPLAEVMEIKRKTVANAIQNMLNTSAKSRGYDSIISECSYATSSGAFGAEAQVTVDWRGSVWNYVFQVEADVLAGTRIEPTLDELLAELPAR